MRNGWLAFALLSAACVGAAVRPVVFPAATAQAPREKCEWRYLQDGHDPEIPQEQEATPMGQAWAAMGAAGYRLAGQGLMGGYIFERCVPAN